MKPAPRNAAAPAPRLSLRGRSLSGLSLPGLPTGRPRGLRRDTKLLLELELGHGLLEAPPSSPVEALRAVHTPTLRRLVDALARAAGDDRVVGLVAHVGNRQPSLAQSSELRAAVRSFAAAGKPTVCWSESYGELGPSNVGYHLASAFQEVWIQPSGDLGLTGVSAEAVFVRDTLDKVGVETQIGQRSEYKTAANMFLESGLTEAHREMLGRIVESALETIVADVAESRGLDPESVREAVDAAPLAPEEAVRRGLVDRVGYRDEVYAALRARLRTGAGGADGDAAGGGREGEPELRFLDRYGRGLAGIAQTATSTARRRPAVAVVQASGPIHLGRSGGPSPFAGHSVGSDSLGSALRAAAKDRSVRAVVLRVDSPGGSYVASDAIRREVLALRKTGKPVVASMADVAGSGGYYIAMPADWVVASPGTLTGSIGVLAGKQVIRDALAHVGVQRESVSSGRYADMFSTQRRFSDDEWQRLEAWLDRVYDDFTAKAAEDRGMPVDRLREVAKGRVWTGADAVGVGLVDELGGLSKAVDVACARAGLSRPDVDVRRLPKTTLLDRLRPPESSDAPAAARFWERRPLVDQALDQLCLRLGLPPCGVLTMPFGVRLS